MQWLTAVLIDSSNEQPFYLQYFPGDDLFTPLTRRKGLPIGNQTSQFFANVYLNPLDHFIKEHMRCRHYLRYVDDFLLFGSNKADLWRMGAEIGHFLEQLRLKIHQYKFNLFPVQNGISFLGYRVFPNFILLPKMNISRFRRRMKYVIHSYARGSIDLHRVKASIHGWLGHALQADSYNLRKDLFSSIILPGPKNVH